MIDLLNNQKLADRLWDLIENNKIIMLPYTGNQYLIWNEIVYQFLVRDTQRNKAYQKTIANNVKDKIVVEIGPGAKLFMTMLCVEAGAKKIYAIEGNPTAYQNAKKIIQADGLNDKIILIPGVSTEVDLPEKVDICLSEIIGSIGNAEGASIFLDDAKKFLKADGKMIPQKCITWISLVTKPKNVYTSEFVDKLANEFKKSLYSKMNSEFKITRFKVYNCYDKDLLNPSLKFEEMHFGRGNFSANFTKEFSITCHKDSVFDGLILWIELFFDDDNSLSSLSRLNWAPVYVEMDSFLLKKGDQVVIKATSKVLKEQFTPQYYFQVTVNREKKIVYNHVNIPDHEKENLITKDIF